jgi:hypothetical protein
MPSCLKAKLDLLILGSEWLTGATYARLNHRFHTLKTTGESYHPQKTTRMNLQLGQEITTDEITHDHAFIPTVPLQTNPAQTALRFLTVVYPH